MMKRYDLAEFDDMVPFSNGAWYSVDEVDAEIDRLKAREKKARGLIVQLAFRIDEEEYPGIDKEAYAFLSEQEPKIAGKCRDVNVLKEKHTSIPFVEHIKVLALELCYQVEVSGASEELTVCSEMASGLYDAIAKKYSELMNDPKTDEEGE